MEDTSIYDCIRDYFDDEEESNDYGNTYEEA